MVETAAAAGIEIPVFCYEPRLGPPVGACRMCLVEVAGDAEAPGRLHALGAGRHGREDGPHLGAGSGGPELDPRVHPRQPPARLPRVRQGRRVPVAGPDVPLRPGSTRDDVSEAHVREADPDLAADRPRPRALHPLLPLHTLQRAGGRGRTAGRDQPRRPVRDRHVRGRAVSSATSPATSRSSARSARSPRRSTASRRARGRSRTSRPCAVSARSAATPPRRRARARSSGSSPATIPRSTKAGCATRAASPTRTSTRATASPRRAQRPDRAASRSSRGTTRSTAPRSCCAPAAPPRVTALSGGESVEEAYALGRLLREGLGANAAVLPEDVPGLGRRLPRAAVRTARRAHHRRRLRRAGRRARTGGRALAEGRAAQGRGDHLRRPRRPGRCARDRRRNHDGRGRRTSTTCPARRTAAASPMRGAQPETASRSTPNRSCS